MPKNVDELIVMPFLPLRGTMVFPHTVLHIDVTRRSVAAINAAMAPTSGFFCWPRRTRTRRSYPGRTVPGRHRRARRRPHLPGNTFAC